MADSTCLQKVACCNCTGSNADTRKDVIIDGMARSTIFSSMNLMDGFYQILMREKGIPYTAVSTPSGMLWEWLVMLQGLSNAPATVQQMCYESVEISARVCTQLFR